MAHFLLYDQRPRRAAVGERSNGRRAGRCVVLASILYDEPDTFKRLRADGRGASAGIASVALCGRRELTPVASAQGILLCCPAMFLSQLSGAASRDGTPTASAALSGPSPAWTCPTLSEDPTGP